MTRLKPKRSQPNESARVTAILRVLQLAGFWAWRVNSSLTVLPAQASHGRRVIKGAPAGSPDIMLVIPVVASALSLGEGGMRLESATYGALGGLEVKTDKGKQSATQRAWQRKAEAHGVRYEVVREPGEALRVAKAWRAGKPWISEGRDGT